jgi:NAD(P)-dependent dehydrogenase (short-subunit alcohol dehydrogenase family)
MDSTQLFRVDGMVAVVTGGGSGIGLMMARALAGAGAQKVYILGRRRALLEEAAASHAALTPLECDVTSKASLQAAVDAIAGAEGYINLLVANSGVSGPGKRYDPALSVGELRRALFDEVDMDDFTDTFRVNVTGAYFSMLAFLELLDAGNRHAVAQRSFGAPVAPESDVPSVQSQVIVTSSISAYSRAAPSTPAYSGSKAAIAHLAKHASTNLAKYSIRVNALAPGCKCGPRIAPLPSSFPLLHKLTDPFPSVPFGAGQGHDWRARPWQGTL